MLMLKKEANKITGGLSKPGKMPEGSYNIPASACETGQILAKVEGTPCSGCYALKNRYAMPIQKAAMQRRLASLSHPRWVEATTTLVKKKKHFRWHDSGDIQSVKHLINIFEVCKNTPTTTCPAKDQGNKCMDCRACWDRSVSNVTYPKH